MNNKGFCGLRFRLDKDAPNAYIKRWKKLQQMLTQTSIQRTEFLRVCTKQFNLLSNRALPILNRCEGGLGGDTNATDKQIRFDDIWNIPMEIPMVVLASEDEKSFWTLEELFDIIDGVTNAINEYMDAECCKGEVVMRRK